MKTPAFFQPFLQKKTYLHSPLLHIAYLTLCLIIVYSLCRLVFFLFNLPHFPEARALYFFAGIRFDLAAIFIFNAPYFLLLLLPFRFVGTPTCRKIGNIYFIVINLIAVLANLIDTCYYPFSMRRMTFDIFSFIGETGNFGALLPLFFKDYYYMVIIFLGFVLLMMAVVYFSKFIEYKEFVIKGKSLLVQIAVRVLLLGLMVLGTRGGLQLRPLTIASAGEYGGVEYASLILNSPFSLINTIQSEKLMGYTYYSDEVCDRKFSIKRESFENQRFTPQQTDNVVVIILEGISSEYSSAMADEPKPMAGFTPFLDSLAERSITFRGMANGQHSIEAVSSVLGGIPSLMAKPFCQTQYATNYVSYPLPVLKKQGMSTHFYHGGLNGTMSFDRMSHIEGVDHYYGMDEYPNSRRDFDGCWGLPDVPYLNYVADQLDQIDGRFFATIFTLTSHHPFKVPAEYDDKVAQGDFPMQHTVAYTDEALRQFFAKVSQTEWYQNTLFVITADHTNFDGADAVDYQKHRYSIPMIFFHPAQQEVFHSDEIMQQVDIMPAIFGYCSFKGKFVSFGHNVFDRTTPRFAINYLSGTYQFYISHYLMEFDGDKILRIWDLEKEEGSRAIASDAIPQFSEYETLMKAVIQQYTCGLLRNQLKIN